MRRDLGQNHVVRQGGGGAQACCHPAPHVGRRHAVQLAGKGGRSLVEATPSFPQQRETLSLPGRCGGEIVLMPCERCQATAISTWICQRHLTPSCEGRCPYRGENQGLGKDNRGELDTQTRN